MFTKNFLKNPIRRHHKIYAFLLALVIEGTIGAFVWKHSGKSAIVGFLVKDGNRYVLTWKDADSGYSTQTYDDLHDAIDFAQSDLSLKLGHNADLDQSIERAWIQDRSGTYTLLWKSLGDSYLNRLNFSRQADAVFFEDAFRRGSYITSPFGHSVLLVPAKAD